MTGVAFGQLGDAVTGNSMIDIPGGLLLRTRVFGRMTPENKVSCVERHKALGIITGMCGDGGNDAGALRVSHAGVALSDAEASMVSPFTSRSRTVMSVVEVMREGRCALCTSFAAVKYQVSAHPCPSPVTISFSVPVPVLVPVPLFQPFSFSLFPSFSFSLFSPGLSLKTQIFFLRTAPRDHQPPTASHRQPPTATNRQPPAATDCQPPSANPEVEKVP